jgi:hypothetical protein
MGGRLVSYLENPEMPVRLFSKSSESDDEPARCENQRKNLNSAFSLARLRLLVISYS